MSPLTTHVLDIGAGRPAERVKVDLEVLKDSHWQKIATGITDGDGRIKDLIGDPKLFTTGTYRLTFHTKDYFDARDQKTFFPVANITFEVDDPGAHYHVPLLVSGYGYSTYRGS